MKQRRREQFKVGGAETLEEVPQWENKAAAEFKERMGIG